MITEQKASLQRGRMWSLEVALAWCGSVSVSWRNWRRPSRVFIPLPRLYEIAVLPHSTSSLIDEALYKGGWKVGVSVPWPRAQWEFREHPTTMCENGISNTIAVLYPFRSQRLLCMSPHLTLQKPTFCSQSEFVCLLWISEQIAIISFYSIKWRGFITETECLLRGRSV